MNTLPLLNLENVTEAEAATYKARTAARAVVLDADGNVALLHATTMGYYKLPGGGVDEGESLEQALLRECKEEIGCEVAILSEVASLLEYRKSTTQVQTSYCYLARVVGEKGTPHLEPSEEAHGFQAVWLPIADARAAIQSSAIPVINARYMVARETAFLDAAAPLIVAGI